MEAAHLSFIVKQTNISERAVKSTVELLTQGASIPFIARYRKEKTGSLDEQQIERIQEVHTSFLELTARKSYIIEQIKEQGKLSNALHDKIKNCWDSKALEDLYLPYKKKRKTKASLAREAGLEELARLLFWSKTDNPERSAKKFLNQQITSVDEALEGARHIMAEQINEHQVAREITREVFQRSAELQSKSIKSKEAEATKYKNYFEFSQRLNKVPSHRLLAIYRGEQEKLLRVKINIDEEQLERRLSRYFIKSHNACAEQKLLALQDAIKRLLVPAISTEFKQQAKERADDEAIVVFSENLRQLLLQAPLGSKAIMSIDPGFRTGCKLALLDKNGTFIQSKTIFPHPPQRKTDEAQDIILRQLNKFKIKAIAVGNGTAGRETFQWLKSYLPADIEIHLVNENGASIYSASEVAREEFPDLDLTIRGAISIGRRLMDPLAELVKIEPKNIGVGQYQHDVKQTKLKQKLDQVVINCVNQVGINVNTASKHILQYISGLGPTLAENIVQYRQAHGSFTNRKALKNVPRMGSKAYEQCAGFLRIKNSTNILDNTAIHPEAYPIVERMSKSLGIPVKELAQRDQALDQLKLEDFVTEAHGLPSLRDIVTELKRPGQDNRGQAKVNHYTEGIRTIEDLKSGQIVQGIVNNLTKFGAFVDIGIKESALIHISQITNRFIQDPSEILQLGQGIQARVIEVDIERKRIALSMKEV